MTAFPYNAAVDGEVASASGCAQARLVRAKEFLSRHSINADFCLDTGPEQAFAVLSAVGPEIFRVADHMVARFEIPLKEPRETEGWVVRDTSSGTLFDSSAVGLFYQGRAFRVYRQSAGVFCLVFPLAHSGKKIELDDRFEEHRSGLSCWLFEPAD